MPKKDDLQLHPKYNVCEHSDCPMADTCLHQLAYATLIKSENVLHVINPTLCVKGETCEYYRNNEPVTFACGFTQMQERMLPRQYDLFKAICMKQWGRNAYYQRRCGSRVLPPSEQEFIVKALRKSGAPEPFFFDRYFKAQNWCF